jgi:hypothetical protein
MKKYPSTIFVLVFSATFIVLMVFAPPGAKHCTGDALALADTAVQTTTDLADWSSQSIQYAITGLEPNYQRGYEVVDQHDANKLELARLQDECDGNF